ncbi:hypothetical protein HMN09_01031500 [Mycena chlorophos]|uniref:DASH complex subunit SPC19 n=1 Tax=Mycena chlorophos TaxID=658473 RepID=A0A8H6SEL7_MYCCL|nr:hypothetical protein HMN09_01031500 [Mycena chlorophos]
MSRLSRANIKGRDSIFTGGASELYRAEPCPPSLQECVLLMEDCCEEAYEAEALLYAGSQDLPRISKVIQIERHFVLLREDTVNRYKAQLTDEVEPAINELIELSEQGLKSLQKKEALLKTRVDTVRSMRPTAPGAPAAQKLEARRLQQLTRQREALENEIQALEAELGS